MIRWLGRRCSREHVLARTLLMLLFIGVEPLAAWASTFTVSRVQVFLSPSVKSETLTLRNVSTEALRFQLSVFAWDQTPQGELALAPTKDIVFFPPLLTLLPGEERNIRVGTATPAGASEKTYRLFIEELPRQEGAPAPGSPGQVAIRTRLGIPIFLRPPKEIAGARVDGLQLRDGRLSFGVRNTGNVHVVAQTIRITGVGSAGDIVVQTALDGWYILAGGTRTYDLELPADKCPALKTVSVEVQTQRATFSEGIDVTPAACGR